MKHLKIDHLGIAVPSLDQAIAAYEALGFRVEATHDVPTEKVRTAFLPVGRVAPRAARADRPVVGDRALPREALGPAPRLRPRRRPRRGARRDEGARRPAPRRDAPRRRGRLPRGLRPPEGRGRRAARAQGAGAGVARRRGGEPSPRGRSRGGESASTCAMISCPTAEGCGSAAGEGERRLLDVLDAVLAGPGAHRVGRSRRGGSPARAAASRAKPKTVGVGEDDDLEPVRAGERRASRSIAARQARGPRGRGSVRHASEVAPRRRSGAPRRERPRAAARRRARPASRARTKSSEERARSERTSGRSSMKLGSPRSFPTKLRTTRSGSNRRPFASSVSTSITVL